MVALADLGQAPQCVPGVAALALGGVHLLGLAVGVVGKGVGCRLKSGMTGRGGLALKPDGLGRRSGWRRCLGAVRFGVGRGLVLVLVALAGPACAAGCGAARRSARVGAPKCEGVTGALPRIKSWLSPPCCGFDALSSFLVQVPALSDYLALELLSWQEVSAVV